MLCIMINERLSNFGGAVTNNEIHHITSTISHELRTPLNAIMGFSELIKEETSITEIKRFAKIIQENGVSLLNKIHSIIDYNIIELCNDLYIEEIGLVKYLKSFSKDCIIHEGENCDVELECDFAEGLSDLKIYSDKKKLDYILSRMLSYSLKSIRTGKITIGIENNRDKMIEAIQIFIAENNLALSYASNNDIFKPFFHVKDINIDQNMGLGIDLAICRKLAQKIGAKIKYLPKSDKGHRFQICLPISKITDHMSSYDKLPFIVVVAESDALYFSLRNSFDQYSYRIIRILKVTQLERFLVMNNSIKFIIMADSNPKKSSILMNRFTYHFADKCFFLFLFNTTENITQPQRDNLYVFNSESIVQGLSKIVDIITPTDIN